MRTEAPSRRKRQAVSSPMPLLKDEAQSKVAGGEEAGRNAIIRDTSTTSRFGKSRHRPIGKWTYTMLKLESWTDLWEEEDLPCGSSDYGILPLETTWTCYASHVEGAQMMIRRGFDDWRGSNGIVLV